MLKLSSGRALALAGDLRLWLGLKGPESVEGFLAAVANRGVEEWTFRAHDRFDVRLGARLELYYDGEPLAPVDQIRFDNAAGKLEARAYEWGIRERPKSTPRSRIAAFAE